VCDTASRRPVVTEAQLSGIPVIAPAAIEVWSAHLRKVWSSHTVYECYRQRAIGHSRRPEFNRDRLLTRFLDAVSGW
jgi:hypothetical protein